MLSITNNKTLMLRSSGYLKAVQCVPHGEYLDLKFGFDREMIDFVKSMDGARWNPASKCWTINNSERNMFQLQYRACTDFKDQNTNPYYKYNIDLQPFEPKRKLYAHQVIMCQHIVTRKQCILACEMGTGKTLATIEAIEYFVKQYGFFDWWYVAPKSVLSALRLEFKKWGFRVIPFLTTYESLKKELATTRKVPQGIIFDEASRLKNATSQRTQAAMQLTARMRKAHLDPVIILMSGTPAPKNPCDWWSLCEMACPGFLKEGNTDKLRFNLGVWSKDSGVGGQSFFKLATWLDDETKCAVCGNKQDHGLHENIARGDPYHVYKPSVNEVQRLGRRMKGLTLVQLKKDCLDLPEKQFRIIECEVSPAMKRVVSALKKQMSGIRLLEALRELSDGFQYVDKPVPGEFVVCPACAGKGTQQLPLEDFDPENHAEDEAVQTVETKCPKCNGTGKVQRMERGYQYVSSPKEQVLVDLLDEYSDVGRVVIFAGYHAAADICAEICKKNGWEVICLYGGAYKCSVPGYENLDKGLEAFQDKGKTVEKLAFVSIPGSGGMGITLHASPVDINYSNTFSSEARRQSMDRIHRPGMDVNRGATIIDIIHLPTDRYVLDNLTKKADLESMSMEDLRTYIDSSVGEEER